MSQNQPDALVRRKGDYGSYGRQDNASEDGTGTPQIFLGCDAHRKYSVFVTVDERGKASVPVRVEHDRPAFRRFLRGLQPGTLVALEATGSWYWLVDEMETALCRPCVRPSGIPRQRRSAAQR